jgi:hypothetical protein
MLNLHSSGHLLVIALTCTVPAIAQANVLFSNAPDYPATYDSFTSQSDGVSRFQLFSPFQVSQSSPISSVSWQGLYVSSDLTANPPSPDATSFFVGRRHTCLVVDVTEP